MCGFIGLFGNNLGNEYFINKIEKSLKTFQYRGPDDLQIENSKHFSLGFNRLSINNLQSGIQPRRFSYKNNNLDSIICFNGEIFNYKSLESTYLDNHYERDEISLIIDLFKKYGIEFVNLLNGQFSIVIYTSFDKNLYLIRDPFGIRPLYYFLNNKKNDLIITSDLNGMWSYGIKKEVELNQLARLHLTWSTSSDSTIWKNIKQVTPGTISNFKIRENGTITNKVNIFWNWPDKISSQNKNVGENFNEEIKSKFRYEFRSSIKRQKMSDVGISSYVSGGIDSSVVAYELSELIGNYRTYSVAFKDKEYDESANQRILTQNISSNHSEIMINDCDIAENFVDVSKFINQPFFRTAPVPLYLLSQKVSKDGEKVVMTGEGADEILFGYDIFREQNVINFIESKPDSKWRYKIFDNFYSYLPQYKNERYRKLAIQSLMSEGKFDILNPLKSRISNNLRTLKMIDISLDKINEIINNLIEEYKTRVEYYKLDKLDIIQLFEIENLLSGYLLSSQGDRVSMANSVEGRYPYLDLEFVNYALDLPREFKFKATNFKKILRESYSQLIPKPIVRAPKIAYQAPEARAILNSSYIKDLMLDEKNKIYDYYSYERLQKIIRRISNSQSSRGGFCDNMTVCITASLASILND